MASPSNRAPTGLCLFSAIGYNADMKITIRPALVSELAFVQQLNHDLFVSDSPHDSDLDMDWSLGAGRDYFEAAIRGDNAVCLVACDESRVVGYLVGALHQETADYRPLVTSELENMLVLPRYRGHGVGARLVEAFREWSIACGAQVCQVSAYSGNIRAQDFYRRVGFGDYAVTLEMRLAK
jgi:GNAT superfamily N-acetyltransferase